MSRRRTLLSFALVFLGLTLGLTFLIAAAPDEADWKEVNDAIGRGLPKTAIDKLNPIISQAMNEERYAEAIKAISLKVVLEASIQGNKPEEKITRMQSEIAKAPDEMKPVMEAILANWYWHYFQQNRWRFMQRTQTNAAPGDDFTTWDLSRILSEIDTHFDKSLANKDLLQKIPVAQFESLLEKGNAPDSYRPTLFDILATNALEFYASGEQAANRSEDAFDLAADSPVFGPVEDFVAWKPETNDSESLTLQAISLHQQLLRFHKEDDDRSAFLDADLARLRYGHNKAFGEEKSSRYKAALRRFAETNVANVISARALHQLASVVHSEGDWDEAHKIASDGMNRFPDSVGGRRCFNLLHQIEARSCRVVTERVWNDPRPSIDVHYRNITKIHFRLVAFRFDDFIKSARWRPEAMTQAQRGVLLAKQPVRAWSVDLPATNDYQERLERIPSPDDIPAGSYFLIASHNEAFNGTDNQVSFTEIWESKLALVVRNHSGEGRVDGFVLDANEGEPIANATVHVWHRNPRNNGYTALPDMKTDSDGLFQIRNSTRQQLVFLASHGDQSLSSSSYLQPSVNKPAQAREQTMLFTDRALYRPGQTIHYKGICMSIDTNRDNYKTIAGREVTLVFLDVNGKEIEQQKHRTNDYGSFSGSVTAPRDRLMGSMTLQVQSGATGSAPVTVEEYKRPKFRVEVSSPKAAASLNAEVSVPGTATSYTGAAINDATVRWRVVREVRYPVWWFWRCWWMPPQQGGSQEIAHGTTTTAANGGFEILFTAKPDHSVLRESEPTFRYTVYADVTDTTGETRSSRHTINIGYTSLAASISAASWLTEDEPIDLLLRTTTLDGEGQGASGTLQVFEVQQPAQVVRASLTGQQYNFGGSDREPDPANPNSWALGKKVYEVEFETDAAGNSKVSLELKAGMYRVQLKTKDRLGATVTAELPLQVIDPEANQLDLKLPNLYAAPRQSIEPGDQYLAVWGSGYESARAYVEVIHRGKLLQKYWTRPGDTQVAIKQRVDEAMRGGFTVRTTMVRENRSYIHTQRVAVPWTNKQLTLTWEHVVSKLEPGSKETWTAIITGTDAKKRVAEMVATLYDASLDAYQRHDWPGSFGVFRQDYSSVQSMFENQPKNLQQIYRSWSVPRRDGSLTYRRFPSRLMQDHFGYRALNKSRMRRGDASLDSVEVAGAAAEGMRMDMSMNMAAPASAAAGMGEIVGDFSVAVPGSTDEPPSPDLTAVAARKNLNETAFFFPHLTSDSDGVVRLEFTMPEALTEWRFLGFAHDRELRSGLLSGTTVTAKDLMVQPNPPRFLRERDVVEFTVKVSNQSATVQSGTVRLTFADARTNESVDETIGNMVRDQQFEIAAGESKSFSWRLEIPDDLGFMTYKAVGSTGRISDGEEGFLPVLSRRILVTESLPLPIRGSGTKEFSFTKLLESGESDSLKHQSLTVQMVSNPSWYAVMALPYLMEYPHECAEQTFNRLYANSLARHIAGSDPKIHRVFEQWRATPALDSPLEKNEELKAVMVEETPWYRQAQSESQARRNVGILFDDNRLDQETARGLLRLSQMQLPEGAWPWFPGGPANSYITLYITTGFGRVRHLGVDIDTTAAIQSLTHLDGWVTEQYQKIKPENRPRNHLTTTIALYLYGRSFFLKDQEIAAEHREAVDYWLGQAKTYWLDLAYRQSQAHLAVALKRFDQLDAAQAIMKSIKERSVTDDEMGMFWRETELSWWWYRAPIETQAMMIEAFDEVMNDQTAVEDCKVWLLKQKQTQDWKTTKATADAVYALLLRGSDLLASDSLVDISLGGDLVEAKDVEAGTGFYEQRFAGSEIQPKLGEIVVKKRDKGVAWGSVHWQYLEDMQKITPYEGTPLKLTKELYIKKNTSKGPTLERVDGPVSVGDELVVRVVLRTDRDMEYVHLKDYRGSGTEPVNVLSQYKYQDGLGYYETTRDIASHFFIDYLPKGTYVFEYSTRVQLRGDYQTGVASVQCMYAPEFNSHSASLPISVR